MDRFLGRVALVTGASAGIGEAIARELCVIHGMKVIGCARRQQRLDILGQTYADLCVESGSGGQFYGIKCDLENDADIRNMFETIRNHPELGRVDVCVNNAGIWTGEHLVDGDPKIWRRLWNLNVVATSLCTQYSVKLMIEKGITDGHVVIINSLGGHQIMVGGHMVMYNSTKLALTCVTDGWRREMQRLGENKIRISQVSPGLVESEIMYANDPDKSDYSKKVFENTPHLKPGHIAYAVVTQIAAPEECLIRETIVTQVHEAW